MDRGMITRPDHEVVRPGHSHVRNAKLKAIIPSQVASVLPVGPGDTIMHLQEPASRVEVSNYTIRNNLENHLKIQTMTELGMSTCNCASHLNSTNKQHVLIIMFLMNSR